VRAAVVPHLGTEDGRHEVGEGAGGDQTVELDRLAETAALAELRRLAEAGHRFSVLSEEAGLVDMGAPYPRVLLDPVDGSMNAKQGVPISAVMISLAEGPSLADVRIGLALNLVSGERWHAVRGGGFHRNGASVTPLRPVLRDRIELLGLECAPRGLERAQPLLRRAGKLRLLGCMALGLVHTAAGGLEVFCAPFRARIFDMTAGLLMVGEVGGVVTDMEGRPLDGVTVGLEERTTVLAAADPALHRMAIEALHG
jgi:myo-inositol-1(or 4)-monophosphatase